MTSCGNLDNISSECFNYINEYQSIMGNVDLYNIYGDCIDGTLESNMGKKVSKIPNRRVGGPNACINR